MNIKKYFNLSFETCYAVVVLLYYMLIYLVFLYLHIFFLLFLNLHLIDYTLNLIYNYLLYLLKNMIMRSKNYIHFFCYIILCCPTYRQSKKKLNCFARTDDFVGSSYGVHYDLFYFIFIYFFCSPFLYTYLN